MKSIIATLIVLSCICSSYNQNTSLTINQVYKELLPTKSTISKKEVVGQFSYTESDSKDGRFFSMFSTGDHLPSISYISYADNRNDMLMIGKKRFELLSKIAPLSLRVVRIRWNTKQFLAFFGKGQSASGSGVQLTYFILARLNPSMNVTGIHEFESRFGTIDCIIDYNRDETLDYFKITHGKKSDEYSVTINDTRSNKSITADNALLQYKLNDRFIIMNNTFSYHIGPKKDPKQRDPYAYADSVKVKNKR